MKKSSISKKNLHLLYLCGIILLGIITTGYFIKEVFPLSSYRNMSNCDILADKGGVGNDAKSECYSKIAFNDNNIKICDSIVNPNDPTGVRKSMCYGALAAKNNDVRFCETRSLSTVEKSICYAQASVALHNITLCNQIKGDGVENIRVGCTVGIAKLTKNTSVCLVIENQSAQQYCARVVLSEILGRDL